MGSPFDLDDRQRKSVIRKIVANYLLIGLGSLAIGHLVLSCSDFRYP